MKRRTNVSLTGKKTNESIKLDGKKVLSTIINTKEESEYIDIKLKIINNFLDPFIKGQHDRVQKNAFNFDFMLRRLESFKGNNDEEVILIEKVVKVMKQATEYKRSYSDIYNQMYGNTDKTLSRFIFETSRLILKAPFEIYDNLFGDGGASEEYDMRIIAEIEKILEENPGISFDDIKEKIELFGLVLN